MAKSNVPVSVYVLLSLLDNRFYVGITDNLQRRLAEHQSGRTKSTRHRRPFRLLHTEEFPTRRDAVRRERYLKSGSGHKFLESLRNKVVDAPPTASRENGTASG